MDEKELIAKDLAMLIDIREAFLAYLDETIPKDKSGIAFDFSNHPTLDAKSVYEHFYTDNFSGTDFSTHYVVLGYRLVHDLDLNSLPDAQYHSYRWFDVAELLASDQVHDNTKAYFLSDK